MIDLLFTCRYQLVAIDFLQPAAVGRAMTRVAAAVAAGRVGAFLPLSCYGLSEAQHAMRLMSQVCLKVNMAPHVAVLLAVMLCSFSS